MLAFEQSMNVKMITFYVKSLELLVIVTEFPPQPFDKPLKRKTIIKQTVSTLYTKPFKSFETHTIRIWANLTHLQPSLVDWVYKCNGHI